VLRRLKAGLDEPMAAEEAVLEVVAAALRPAAISTDPPAPMRRQVRAHRELAMLARAALAGDLHRPLDLTTLAGRLGVSAWHLCRVFKAQTGMSLRVYRRDLRLRRALERLESGEASCSRLAADLGFSSHSHFTAAFHGRFGCIPSRARSLLHAKERGAAAGALLQALRTFTDQDAGRLR
jgi:AraC-like DNA-binding protein